MSKLTLKEIRKIAIETKHDFRGAMEIIVPENQMKYDKIYLAKQKTKAVMDKC